MSSQLHSALRAFCILLLTGTACSHFSKSKDTSFTFRALLDSIAESTPLLAKEKDVEAEKITSIEADLRDKKSDQAYSAARLFQKDYPRSPYLFWARILEGKSLVQMELYRESLPIFQSIILLAGDEQQELLAYSLFLQAVAHRYLGDFDDALASLLDSATRKDFLPRSVELVELPLEFAEVYSRLGLVDEEKRFEDRARENLKVYLGEVNLSAKQKSEYFLRLGQLGHWQKNSVVAIHSLQGVSTRLGFLVRGIQENVEPESTKAAQILSGYLDFFSDSIANFELPKERADRIVAIENKKVLSQNYYDLLQDLKAMLRVHIPVQTAEEQISTQIEQHLMLARNFIEQKFIRNPLTAESKKRNQVKRGAK